MGDSGWSVVLTFYAFANPVIIAAGILVGLLARRWLHVLFVLILAPGAYWAVYVNFFQVNYFWDLAPALAVGGFIWSAALYGFRRSTLA
jgi:hypothetical protein